MNDQQPTALTVDDFDYALPAELIAQHPAAERTASRLLHLDGEGCTHDHLFAELPRFLRPGDVLVFNDTRVIKARLRGRKATGGKVEVLVERVIDAHEALVQIRASHAPQSGTLLELGDGLRATVLDRTGDLFRLRFAPEESVLALLERFGAIPLPPYIAHAAADEDVERYQTVYARSPGAVAAPTAGLHFDPPMLDALKDAGVILAFITLHVGAGTFQPVRVQRLADHRMHSEWYEIPQGAADAVAQARNSGRSVVAIGTTSLRALESSAARHGEVRPGTAETDLFITPGYRFRAVDRLVTNFHLPKSTLLMLVSAFAGIEPVRRAYAHAIAARYRFFSYGDAMLIDRARAAYPDA
jgi:S-adenosylmethionine:tRNA ribosyltransferase-isomerase